MIDYITPDDYFGPFAEHPDVTPDVQSNAIELINRVNSLMDIAFMGGIDFRVNPQTHSYVSGQTLGGFRPADTAIGSTRSAHKTGQACDIYDPDGDFGAWCLHNLSNLQMIGLCAEHPSVTFGWVHLSTRPVGGKTFFYP